MNRREQIKRKKNERRRRRLETRHHGQGAGQDVLVPVLEPVDAELWRRTEARPKMSRVLMDILEPVIEDFPMPLKLETYRAVAKVGLLAWNISRLPAGERDRERQRVLDALVADGVAPRAELEEAFAMLIERSLSLYPHEPRRMIRVDVTRLPDGDFYVQVAGIGEG